MCACVCVLVFICACLLSRSGSAHDPTTYKQRKWTDKWRDRGRSGGQGQALKVAKYLEEERWIIYMGGAGGYRLHDWNTERPRDGLAFNPCAETLGCSDAHAGAATQLLLGLLHTIWLLMPPLGLRRLLSNRHTSKQSQASPAATGSPCASRAPAESVVPQIKAQPNHCGWNAKNSKSEWTLLASFALKMYH